MLLSLTFAFPKPKIRTHMHVPLLEIPKETLDKLNVLKADFQKGTRATVILELLLLDDILLPSTLFYRAYHGRRTENCLSQDI
jgi:hypothetical protein